MQLGLVSQLVGLLVGLQVVLAESPRRRVRLAGVTLSTNVELQHGRGDHERGSQEAAALAEGMEAAGALIENLEQEVADL